MKIISGKSCRKRSKLVFNVQYFFFLLQKWCRVWDNVKKNVVHPDRPKKTI